MNYILEWNTGLTFFHFHSIQIEICSDYILTCMTSCQLIASIFLLLPCYFGFVEYVVRW